MYTSYGRENVLSFTIHSYLFENEECPAISTFPEDPQRKKFFFWVALYYDSNVHLLIIFSQSPLRDEVVVIVTSWNATCSDYNVAENKDTV